MKDYFSHDYNSRNDKKLVNAFMKHGLESIGAYWCIVEMLYEEFGYLPLSEYERITFELRTNQNIIKYLIFDSDLFQNDGIKFWSNTAIERLKLRSEKSEKARKSIENRWNKNKDTNVLQSNEERNTNKGKESKVKESKVKRKTKVFIPPTILEVKQYFKENGYNEQSGERAFKYYDVADWYDSKGTKVSNWKQKMQSVWFKDENKSNNITNTGKPKLAGT